MPRKPKVRTSYVADAQYLLRLVHALEDDKKRPVSWRQSMIAQCQSLAKQFLMAPAAGEEDITGPVEKQG